MGEKKVLNTILAIILLISLSLLFIENISAITGHASQGSTVSNVTITRYLSIDFSAALINEGIQFGNITALPAVDINASRNYDGLLNATQYNISVSTDSNTPVDLCIAANSALSNGVDEIPLENETYAVSTNLTNFTIPDVLNQTSLTLAYVKPLESSAVPIGNSTHWRFWLDVPVAQAVGDYNNSIYFRGVAQTLACGAV